MKVPVIFFLLLFFQLSGICSAAHASDSMPQIGSANSAFFQKNQQLNKVNERDGFLLIADNSIPGENAPLILADDGDDDENFTRRQLPPTRYFAALYHSFIDYFRCNYNVSDQSFYKHPFYSGSSKYILQRALRL